jgi:hypothetical protein
MTDFFVSGNAAGIILVAAAIYFAYLVWAMHYNR